MDQKYHLFYELAYNLAQVAYDQDEVPVGAVIIKDSTSEVISSSHPDRINAATLMPNK